MYQQEGEIKPSIIVGLPGVIKMEEKIVEE